MTPATLPSLRSITCAGAAPGGEGVCGRARQRSPAVQSIAGATSRMSESALRAMCGFVGSPCGDT